MVGISFFYQSNRNQIHEILCTYVPTDIQKCYYIKIFFSVASKPINIRWIRTGSKQK